MNRARLRLGLVCALLAASVACPLALQHRAQRQWQDRIESLRRQAEEVTRWEVANERRSQLVARATPATPLSAAQLRELLRLRSQVGQLRRQARLVQQLLDENQRLQAGAPFDPDASPVTSSDDLDSALATQTLQAARNIALALPAALQRFAEDHTNALPADFSQLRRYFPAGGGRLTGLSLFEFVRESGPLPGDSLILRESGNREGPDGTSRRVYALGDGRVLEAISEDGEFDEWEKAQGLQPSATER
jgi:hypothetical protein